MDFDSMPLEHAVTELGNLAVVGPAAFMVWLWLSHRRGPAAAWRFLWPVATVFALTILLKMVSRDMGGSFAGTPFMLSEGAPSGHVGMSTVVYGGVTLMLLRRGVEPIGVLACLLTAMTLTGIAITRVTLHAHTPADVAAGFVLGGVCAVWAARQAEVPAREPVHRVAELVLLLVVVVALMEFSGLRFDSAAVI